MHWNHSQNLATDLVEPVQDLLLLLPLNLENEACTVLGPDDKPHTPLLLLEIESGCCHQNNLCIIPPSLCQ